MTDSFEVGEVAIVKIDRKGNPASIECEIVSKPMMKWGKLGYGIFVPGEFADNSYPELPRGAWFCLSSDLCKKKPPQEDRSWAAEQYRTNWQPDKGMLPVSDQSHTSTIPVREQSHG